MDQITKMDANGGIKVLDLLPCPIVMPDGYLDLGNALDYYRSIYPNEVINIVCLNQRG